MAEESHSIDVPKTTGVSWRTTSMTAPGPRGAHINASMVGTFEGGQRRIVPKVVDDYSEEWQELVAAAVETA